VSEIVSWTALVLGVGLIATHLAVAIAATLKAPGGDIRLHSEATRRVFDLLERLGNRAALVAAGVVLILIAALTSGTLGTTVVLGG
jgi:hypothetical protein